jgi:hypothetical protein
VLGTLPGGEHWVRLLFFDLFLLGIDSAFAFLEAISTVVSDTIFFKDTAKWKISLGLCTIGFLLSLMYATDAGLNFLDVIDFYINFVMILVGFFECFAAGWVYGIEKTIQKCGHVATYSYMVANFAAVFLACGIWFGVDPDAGAVWAGFVALFLWYFVFVAIALGALNAHIKTSGADFTESLWALTFENIFDLKERIEPVCRWIPGVWCILIKQFLPQVLIILFINLARSETDAGVPIFGNYGGYSDKPYQVMGILTFVFTLVVFTAGMAFPIIYHPLALPPGHYALDPDPTSSEKDHEKTKNSPSESNDDNNNEEGSGVTNPEPDRGAVTEYKA